MPVSLATAASLVNQELNANTTYSASSSDPRWYTAGISDAILGADGLICGHIAANPNHPRQSAFYTTSSGVAHGATLTNLAGPVAAVEFVITGGTSAGTKAGQPGDRVEIERERLNSLSLTRIDPHFLLDGNVIYHNDLGIANGGSVSVNVTYPTFTLTSACQSPPEYLWPVVVGALAVLFALEGSNVQAASHYGGLWQAMLSALTSGSAMPQQ